MLIRIGISRARSSGMAPPPTPGGASSVLLLETGFGVVYEAGGYVLLEAQ